MAIISPDEWLEQNGGDGGSAGGTTNAPQTNRLTPTSSILDPDQWLAQQIKNGNVLPPGHPANTSHKDGSKVQLLDNTPAKPYSFQPPPASPAGAVTSVGHEAKQFVSPTLNIAPPESEVQYAQQSNNPLVKAALGVRQGVDATASSLTSPLAISTGMAGEAVPLLGKALQALFTLQTGKQAAVDTPTQLGTELGKNKQDQDLTKVAKLAASEVLNTGATAMLGKGLMEKPPISEPEPNKAPLGGAIGDAYKEQQSKLTRVEPRTAQELPVKSVVLPSDLVDRALREAQSGIIPADSAKTGGALGELWRTQFNKAGLLVKGGSDVSVEAKPTEEGGKVSFHAPADAGAIPSARQLGAKPIEKLGEQESLMKGSFVPGADKRDNINVPSADKRDNIKRAPIEHPSLSLRPAVKLSDGTVIPGQRGDIHNDIILREAKSGNYKPMTDPGVQRGFIKVGEEGTFLSRDEAAKVVGESEPLISERLNELQGEQSNQRSPAVAAVETKTTGTQSNPNPSSSPSSSSSSSSTPQPNVSFEHQVLGLNKPSVPTIDVAKNIASAPELYGDQEAGLMRYLVDKFGPTLRRSITKLGEKSGVSGVLYSTKDNTIYGMRQSNDPLNDFMHEATHAATYDALEAPTTFEQRRAVDTIEALRNQVINLLPSEVKKFFNDKFLPALSSASEKTGIEFDTANKLFSDSNINYDWFRRLYQLSDNHEYLAGVFDDASFRQHLNGLAAVEEEGFVKQTWNAIKDLLGIKKGSVLDKTFDSLNDLHDPLDVKRGSDFPPEPSEGGETGKTQRLPPNAITVSQNFFADNRPNKSWREEADANLGYLAGKTAPRTMAADKDVGEKLIRYGSSSIAGPAWGKALASRVLGEHWQDSDYATKLGAALTQDRLQVIRNSLAEHGQDDDAAKVRNVWDMAGSPFKNEAEYRKALRDSDIQKSVELHRENIQPLALAQHIATGGKVAKAGPDTDAFINLIAMKGKGETGGVDEAESTHNLIYGSSKGELSNPIKKGSVFSKPAKGTAEAYDFNYRNVAERMVSGNYEQAALRDLYGSYLRKGLAIEEKPGVEAPVIRGKPAVKVPIEIRATPWGGLQRKNLWVEQTLAPELEAALATDKPIRSTALTATIGAINDFQIAGPTDAVLHVGNMWAAIAGSQGGRGIMVDLARQVPGIRGLDTMARIAYNIKRVMIDSPAVQEELARISEIGAGRAANVHQSLVGDTLKKVLSEDLVNQISPSRLIKILDQAGRLSLNHMYDNLVKRGLTKESPDGRREFINQMGQYNARLRGKFDTLFRETGISPFIVAGKNFNRLATQRLLLHPGFATANPQALFKTRLVNAVGLFATVGSMPLVINSYTTGNPFGRKDKNIPLGAIDTGKDDKDGNAITLDLLHGTFLRRALRITGESAVESGVKAQQPISETLGRAATQVLEGYLGPFTGPAPSAIYTALSGKNLRTGQLVSENPYSMGENARAAFVQANPTLAAGYKGWFDSEGADQSFGDKAKSIVGRELGQIRQAVGVSTARNKTISQQEHEAGVEQMPLTERADKESELKGQRKPLTDSRQRLEMETEFAARQRENVREIQGSLSKESRDFVASNQLVLPEYSEKLHLQKLSGQPSRDINLLPKERVQYRRIMTQEYQKSLDELKSDSYFASLPQDEKQKALGSMISQAHKRAKSRMEQALSQTAEQSLAH